MKKRNRVIGTETFVNPATGEYKEMQIMETEEYEKDSNFHKLFLSGFLPALEGIGNRKTKIFCWILKNLTRDNRLPYTYRQIADKTGTSYATAAETMQSLMDADFLRRDGSGCYIINPGILFKGTYQRRCIALGSYLEADRGENVNADETRLKEIKKNIARLQKQAEQLQKNIDIQKSDLT